MSRSSPPLAPSTPKGDAKLIVIGPSPPPDHGVTIMTGHLVDAVGRAGLLAAHLDTADRRPVESVGHLDLTNVRLALSHALQLIRLLRRHPHARVYAPISQGRWGLLRDALLLGLARIARRGRIVHLHGSRFAAFRAQSGPLVRIAIRVAVGGAEQAWVLTESLRGAFGELVPGDRVHVVENCVADGGAEPAGAARRGLTVLCLANLLPDKGHADLLDALAMLDAGPLEVRLVGEADATTAKRVEQRCNALAARGIDARLVGHADAAAKREELARADIFVCPSHDEGQPLVILEAMAAGLPILATDTGGVAETLGSGRSGVLVPAGSPKHLCAELCRLIGDSELRRSLGLAARRRYLANYTPAVFARRVASLLTGFAPGFAGNATRVEGDDG